MTPGTRCTCKNCSAGLWERYCIATRDLSEAEAKRIRDILARREMREFRKVGGSWIVQQRFYSPTKYPNLRTALMHMRARDLFSTERAGRLHG